MQVSLDPVTGVGVPYPEHVWRKIEDAHAASKPCVFLGPACYNATIVFEADGQV